MGKKLTNNIRKGASTSLLFIFMSCCSFIQLYAHDLDSDLIINDQGRPSTSSWADKWVGLKVELSLINLGVELKSASLTPDSRFVSPQIGGRMIFGVILDKQSKNPMTLLVGWGRSTNRDRHKLSENISTTSLYDIGIEYPLKHLLYNAKDKVSFDIGAFASSCCVAYTDGNSLLKWGLSTRLSLSYTHKLEGGLHIGCRLYDQFGYYFGSKRGPNSVNHPFANELGLALTISY